MHCGMYQMYHALVLVGNILTVQLGSRTQERQNKSNFLATFKQKQGRESS